MVTVTAKSVIICFDDPQSLAFLHAHDCSERTAYVGHLFADG